MSVFKPFEKDPDKFAVVGKHLLTRYLYLSDEQRNPDTVAQFLNIAFYKPDCEAYELGDTDGFISFYGIIPGHKCLMAVKIWNPKLWKPSAVKEAKKIFSDFIKRTEVKRITIETADTEMVRLGRIFGFHVEGIKEIDFKWDGELYDRYILALLPKEE